MTRTHEEAGLRKPMDRATKMCPVDRKSLEPIARYAAHPACGVYGLAVCRHYVRIAKSSQPRLALRKLVNATERDPREIAVRAPARNRRKQEANYRHRQHHRCESIEQDSELHEEAAPGKCALSRRDNHTLSRHFHFSRCSE